MAEIGSAEKLELVSIARRFEGVMGIYAERLEEPAVTADVGGDEVIPAASVIVIALALEVFCQVEEGKVTLADRVTLRGDDKVIGPGVLAALADGLAPTLGDLVHLSMTISDNTAANMLVERIGAGAVNRRLASLGLTKTRLSGKLFVDETKNGAPAVEDFGAQTSEPPLVDGDDGDDGRGERSPATARELVRLLSAVYRREGLPERACAALLDTLQRTQTVSCIRRGLPESRFRDRAPARLYYKTGALRGVVNDVGIVATERGTYAVALLSHGSKDLRPTQDNVARVAFVEVSKILYKAMGG